MASTIPSATAIVASTAVPMAGISSSQEAGIIAGGVIGAILLFALAGFALYRFERRARSRRFSASSDTLVEKERGKEQDSPSKKSPSIPPLTPIGEMTMAPKPKQADSDASQGPISELPSILRRPDPAFASDQINPLRRGLTLRFRDDTIRPPPPGPLRLVGSPATDSSTSPAPWQSAPDSSPPSRRSVSITEISSPIYSGLPPRPTTYLSPAQSPAASRTQSPAAPRTQLPAVSRALSPIGSDVLPLRSAPPTAFGFAKDPFKTPTSSEDGHGRRSLDSIPERMAPSPASSTPMLLRSVSTYTSPTPNNRMLSPTPASRTLSPTPASRTLSPTPMSRTTSQMPISRNVSLRRVPSSGRPGLPSTPRPTVAIPPPVPTDMPPMPNTRPLSSANNLRSLETPVYPSQFSPVDGDDLDEPRYFTVDMGNGPTLARTMSARELHRAQTARAAPMLWRHPTARVPGTAVDMV
ncbi:unnamed protein product [Peniophora sp. CBMAI 1063]|nr:unnamed protein product [Peniophora sp. CBMAI 1063]